MGASYLPLFGDVARKYRHSVSPDWPVDETDARIRGRWHYLYRAFDGYGQIVDAYVSPTRDTVAARRFFERAIASSGTTPRRVITNKAATHPPALAAAVPCVLHRTGRYRTNRVERDHGFLKERLRPMRGLTSILLAAIFMRGHALMRNIRRGFYRIVESVPQPLVFAWTWNRLAGACDTPEDRLVSNECIGRRLLSLHNPTPMQENPRKAGGSPRTSLFASAPSSTAG